MKELRAFNLTLAELNDSVFFRGEAEFEPHYVITKRGERVSRVNAWGVVSRTFESENDFASISIDDFTGTIDANAFKDTLSLVKKSRKGDTVRVIGKVRENNRGLYILAEGVRKISFEEEMLKRLQNIESFQRKPEGKPGKRKKQDFAEFKPANELEIEREVIE